jgi:hypothetical protein
MDGVRANDVPRKILAAQSDHSPKVRPFGPVFPTTRCPGDNVLQGRHFYLPRPISVNRSRRVAGPRAAEPPTFLWKGAPLHTTPTENNAACAHQRGAEKAKGENT